MSEEVENEEQVELSPEEKAIIENYGDDEDKKLIAQERKPDEVKATEKVEEKPEEKPEDTRPPKGYVRHEALHEERMRRKEMQAQYNELQEKFARADERIKLLFEGNKTVPDKDEDPDAYQEHLRSKMDEEIKNTRKQTEDKIQALEKQLQGSQLKTTLELQEAQFSAKNPDYSEALSYYINSRSEALQEIGIDEEEAMEAVQAELTNISSESVRRGRNAAQVVYGLAKKSGYTQKQTDASNQKGEASKSASQLETIRQGQEDSRDVSSGGAVKGELTAKDLAEMSDEEFSKIPYAVFKKAMGG